MKKERTVPCTVKLPDGTRCGQRVKVSNVRPDMPAVCYVHRTIPARRPQTAQDVITSLMHSKDENIRLRAADAFLKQQERQTSCPMCSVKQVEDLERLTAVHRLTYEQRGQVKELTQALRDILEVARAQPLTWDHETMQYADEPEPIVVPRPLPPPAEPVVTEESTDDEEEEEEPEDDPLTIPPDES